MSISNVKLRYTLSWANRRNRIIRAGTQRGLRRCLPPTLRRLCMGGGLRKPFLKGVDILNALIVAHTKTDIQQLKVIIAGDAARRWTEVQTTRLIDADVASCWMEQNEAYMNAEILRAIPTIDAVPVVRCKDCKYTYINPSGAILCSSSMHMKKQDDFCDYGDIKDGGVDNETD